MNKRKYYRDTENYRRIFHRGGIVMIPIGVIFFVCSLFFLVSTSIKPVESLALVLAIASAIIIVAGVGCFVVYLREPPVPTYSIPKMKFRANNRANQISRIFNSATLVDVLDIAPRTRWGYKLPSVYCYVADDLDSGFIVIENLGQFSKLSRSSLSESVSGVLNSGVVKDYEIVRSDLVLGGLFMRFDFEDLVNSERLVIHNHDLTPYISSNKHDIALGKSLIWHARKYPMMSLIARTGAGKSVLANYIASVAKLQGWDVIYNSAKRDKYVIKYGGTYEPEKIVEVAEHYIEIMQRRLEQIAAARKNDYADVNLNDILLVFDELGNLNARLADDKKLKSRWNSALSSLAMTGRSAGIHLLLISQFGTIDGFVISSVRAQVSDVVIMLGNAASSADERQYVMGGYPDVPKRTYEVGEGLALVSGAGRKWQEPHYYQAPWIE